MTRSSAEAYDPQHDIKARMWELDVLPYQTVDVSGKLYSSDNSFLAVEENKLYFLAGYRMPGEASGLRSQVHIFGTTVNGDGWRTFEPVDEGKGKKLCGRSCVLKQGY
ncbi:unnamed protein product [Fraxinus pennsylvanica]|uniref:Uncharacterized protein n=1 Tax=Fraxinus pennsylvanica TaxID=56036 RepID=A0AAD2EGX9_9LAMI|nr:unnamed protein product [Fraxinus pennsylvanica]